MDGYEKLANDIVITAFNDYKSSLVRLKVNPRHIDALSQIYELERFFKSEWFRQLTNVNAKYVISKIKEGVYHDSN